MTTRTAASVPTTTDRLGIVAVAVGLAVLLVAALAGCAVQAESPTGEAGVGASIDANVRDTDNGALPDDARITDTELPGISGLDADLRTAVTAAAESARLDGVTFTVNSGWRSAAYQAGLLDDAVSTYGSKAEAARWVATPETSPHVSGDAVDIGPVDASSWLSQHGADFGLCQIYGNEAWHYELRPEAQTDGCPQQYADPTEDPRML